MADTLELLQDGATIALDKVAGQEIVEGRPDHWGLVGDAWTKTWLDRFRGKLRPLDRVRLGMIEERNCYDVLRRPETVLLVARPVGTPPDDDHAVGFIVCAPERRVLHLLYVRNKGWRNHGLGNALLEAAFGEPGEPLPVSLVGARGTRCMRRWRLSFEPGALLPAFKAENLTAALKRTYDPRALRSVLFDNIPRGWFDHSDTPTPEGAAT